LLALALLNGPAFDSAHHVQFALLIGGVALLVLGFGGTAVQRWPGPRWGLLAIILLAAGLRLWNLDHAVHFYVDEGNFVEGILRLRSETNVRLMGPFNYIAAFTWVYPYLQWASAEVLGSNLLALRVVSAAFGVLTAAAMYRLGMVVFNSRVGLLAALALAVFPPHIHFSRLGLNNIADPLFGVLALAYLARGIKHRRWQDFALAGLMLGLTQYFYEGGRLLYPVLALVWGTIATRAWRGRVRHLVVTVLVAVWVALPVYYTLLAWDISLSTRLNRRGFEAGYWRNLLLQPGALLPHLRDHVLAPFLHYVVLPDESAFFYGGYSALLLPHVVPVWLIGIIAALRRSGVAALLPLLWLALVALGNSLIRDSVWTARYVAAFPALALLLGVGLDVILKWLGVGEGLRPSPTIGKRIDLPLRLYIFALIVFLLIFTQVAYYFGPHLSAYQSRIRPHHDQQDVVFRLRALPPGTRVYWITDDPDVWMPLLVFLTRYWGMPDFAPERIHPNAIEGWEGLDTLDPHVPHAFFVDQEDRRAQDYLRTRFNLGEPTFSPYNVPREKQYVLLLYRPEHE
jgi:hypothetical protein